LGGQSLRSQDSETPNTFKLFISRGLVSIDGSNAEMNEIRILRDTTVTASRRSPERSATGETVLICVVELGCSPPLSVFTLGSRNHKTEPCTMEH